MDKYSIPKNYKVVEFGGLKGIVKVAKDDSEKYVMECINDICLPAKSYGRIFIAHMLAMDNSTIYIRNHNGNTVSNMPIYDVRLGASCIYVRTIKPNTDEMTWCLLDKELRPIKYIGNFKITDRYCSDNYYIQIKREFMEVTRPDGKVYSLQLTTGDMEEVRKSRNTEQRLGRVANPSKYKIIVDTRKNAIEAIPDVGAAINVNAVANIGTYIEMYSSLLGKKADKTKKSVVVRNHTEECVEYTFDNVGVELAERFIKVIRRLEYMGDGSVIPLLAKYVKAKNKGTEFNMLDELNNELSGGFKTVVKEQDGTYSVKSYIFGSELYTLVKNKNGRIVTSTYGLSGGAFDQNDILVIEKAYQMAGFKAVELEADTFETNIIECSTEQTHKIPRPFSIVNKKETNSNIKNSYYTRIIEVSVDNKVKLGDGYENISFSIVICDGFTYTPKSQRSAKTVVTKGKTNNILVMIS